MRYLPLLFTKGSLLSQVIREAQQDHHRQGLCSCCGARIYIRRDRPDAEIRCPACLRVQPAETGTEVPWRLTANSAEALRRIKSWPRSCWPNR